MDEAAEGCQTGVTTASAIAAVLFQIIQKRQHSLVTKLAQFQGGRLGSISSFEKAKQEPERVPVSLAGMLAQIPLLTQVLAEEACQKLSQGNGFHGGGGANC